MTSRGLPGFLRRTRRSDFGESSEDEACFSSDDDNDNDDVGDDHDHDDHDANVNAGDESNNKNLVENEAVMSLDTSAAENAAATTTSSSTTTTDDDGNDGGDGSITSFQRQQIQQREDSVSSLGSTRGGVFSDRKLNYRESKFDNIFAADTVKMADLRTLGWNGIPVR